MCSTASATGIHGKAVNQLRQAQPEQLPMQTQAERPNGSFAKVKKEDDDIASYQVSDPYNATLESVKEPNRTVPHWTENKASEWSRTNLTAAERPFVKDYVSLQFKRSRRNWIKDQQERIDNFK